MPAATSTRAARRHGRRCSAASSARWTPARRWNLPSSTSASRAPRVYPATTTSAGRWLQNGGVLGNLALRNVSKRFGTTVVLDDVSLEIGASEFLVVLGPSGCGKSTLLRAIAGLESIDAGEIEIDGERVDQLAPGQRGVAMVFQGYALYPHMSVRGNIAFGLKNIGTGRTEIERRIAEVARMLEMEHLLDRMPSELSGGQRQRVAIGRAIVKDPKVFMFDEPLSNLDAALRSRTRQEIANLHRRIKKAMVFVTHDQTEAMTLADRIVVMNQRRIEQIGTPLQVYRQRRAD